LIIFFVVRDEFPHLAIGVNVIYPSGCNKKQDDLKSHFLTFRDGDGGDTPEFNISLHYNTPQNNIMDAAAAQQMRPRPPTTIERYKPFSFFMMGIFIASILTINASRDNALLSSYSVYNYTVLFVVSLLAAFAVSQYFSLATVKKSILIYEMLNIYLFFIFVMLVCIYFRDLLKLNKNNVMNLILVIFIIFNALTIFYSGFFSASAVKSDALLQFIFFIPCMITDGLKYIFGDLHNTTAMVYVLCILEAVFIFFYFALPYYLSDPSFTKRVAIVDSPVMLNVEYLAAQSDLFHVAPPSSTSKNSYVTRNDTDPESLKNQSLSNILYSWVNKIHSFFTGIKLFGGPLPLPDPDSSEDITFNKTYSISFWAYVNPTPISRETRIFDYGGGKPSLTFTPLVNKTELDELASPSSSMGQFKAYFSNVNSDEHFVAFTLPLQKWNNFVYSYDNGTCVLYINGEAFYTDELGADAPTYNMTDTMVVGEDYGLYGSICNVNYHENPLQLNDIIATYNLLSVYNPPIFAPQINSTWSDYFNLHTILRK